MTGQTFNVEIRPIIPQRLARLNELANDLYFSWSRGVRRLFRQLDRETWDACNHNPKVFIRRVGQDKLDLAAKDPILFAEYRRVLSVYDTYLEQRPHTDTASYLDPETDLVAYFSAEFGFHQSMPIYAGGLGILAADYCKAMSNLWVPFVGVGMLYRQGYFTQRIVAGGDQIAEYTTTDPEDLPVSPAMSADGKEILVHVDLSGRAVWLRVWEARAGHIRLYLLDSDIAQNPSQDRSITHHLYGGDASMRLQQDIVLGIGGVRALRAMGLSPSVWHINEGHSAFQILERCREQVASGNDFDSALELVASNTVFTTHTPVPAGHDIFSSELMDAYFAGMATELGIDRSRLMALGANPNNGRDFNMTALALRGSRHHNGVSQIHGSIASEMESYIWPQIPPSENPLGYVTNGVDVETFLGQPWVSAFDMYMGGGWRAKLTDQDFWRNLIDNFPNYVFLSCRQVLKAEMFEYARSRLEVRLRRNGGTESFVSHVTRHLNTKNLDTLVIGFARRFATYKRATLLFQDLKRLAQIVNDPERPVLFLFAGKAHPNDEPGKAVLKRVHEISVHPDFLGKIMLLEDYNISMARELMPGVDVWVNVPEFPKEACGTSGMKAAINGAINLSVLDGWWAEAFDGNNGWAITPHPELETATRDQREASELLDLLEHQVIPMFYERNHSGERQFWVDKAKASMKSILPRFNSIRMAMDYLQHYYRPAAQQGRALAQNGATGAIELAAWKRKIIDAWPKVTVSLYSPPPGAIKAGDPLPVEVVARLHTLSPSDVIVECVLGKQTEFGEFQSFRTVPLSPVGQDTQGGTIYRADLGDNVANESLKGLQSFKIRVHPFHPLLSHPLEHGCMVWL